MSAPALQRKPAKTEGGGMPQWLADHGIQPGEYQYMTKPQLRSQMRPDRPLKVQVWACGMLHTVGYRGETAYTMHRDKRVLLTPADIGKELQAEAVKFYRSAGVELTLEAVKDLRETKEVLRRTIQELERDGICERWSDGRLVREMPRSQAQRLSEKVEYRFFFTPKVAHPEVCKQEWARRTLAKSEHHREAGEVVNSNVPCVPTIKILKTFRIPNLPMLILKHPDFQQAVGEWWQTARESLTQVVKEWLPEVVAPLPPKVVMGRGAFVIKDVTKGSPINPGVGSLFIENPSSQASKQASPPAESSENQKLQDEIRTYLIGRFALPTPPYPDLIAEVAHIVQDQSGFQQFQHATEKTQPRSWKVFLHIARQCGNHRPDYEKARAAGEPGESYFERRAREIVEERRAQKTEASHA